MTELNQIYKCSLCGNIVEINYAGAGKLVCCEQDMQLLIANTVEASSEKHLPVITINESNVEVKIGEVDHPMEAQHYIQWVEIITASRNYKKFLRPEFSPKVIFNISEKPVEVRAYCNLHGLWATKI